MAEIVGLVSAAAGFTSLAIQLGRGVDKLRALYRRSKNLKNELDAIVEELEYIIGFLPDADKCAGRESPQLRAIVQHCNKRAQALVAGIEKLVTKFPDDPDKRSRTSGVVAIIKCRDTQGEIEGLQKNISNLREDLILATMFIMDMRPQRQIGLPQSKGRPTRIQGDIVVRSKLQPKTRSISCDRRPCPCSCHLRGSITRRFWSLEYTPLSMVLQNCDVDTCTARHYRVAFRWVLTPWGFPLAVKFGLDMTAVAGSYSIRPSLEAERVVRYTSLGFRLLWEFETGQITLSQAVADFRQLYKKDPHMIFHVNPAGRGYIENLACYPIHSCFLDQRLALLELFTKEFGMYLGLDSLRLVYRCAARMGNPPHLSFLKSLLDLGLDPSNLPSPHWKLWPHPCSKNGILRKDTRDPFFIECMPLLVTESSDFGGTSPLQNAILTKRNGKVRQLLASANTTNADVNFLGQSPLHVAILQGDTVRILLEAGFDPNIRDYYGCTPLMYAAAVGKLDVVKMLITYGVDLQSVDNIYHQSFIHFAMIRGQYGLVIESLLHIKSEYEEAKWLVLRLAKAAIGLLLLQYSEFRPFATEYFIGLLQFIDDVNYRIEGFGRDVKNSTLLHHIVNYEEAEALIARGFTSFEAQDSKGETPMMNIRMISDPRWLQLCLKNGANLNHQSAEGETVLSLTIRSFGHRHERFGVVLKNRANLLPRDNCVCPCAPGGCLPTRVVKVRFVDHWFYTFTYPLCTFDLLSSFQEYGRLQDATEYILSFIRRSEFEQLGIEHVCCMRDSKRFLRNYEPRLPLEEEGNLLKRNEQKINTLEQYMASLFGMTYGQLEQVWLQQLKRSYDSSTRNWASKSNRVIISDKTDTEFSVDEKNDKFHCRFSIQETPDPKGFLTTWLADHFIGLEARYLEGTKASPKTLQWYKHRAVTLIQLITEFGLDIEDIVGEISKRRPNKGEIRCYLERSEIDECAARIRSWSRDCHGEGCTSKG